MAGFVAMVAVAAVGCAGAGGFQGGPNQFAGDYAGTWVFSKSGANGPATITITTGNLFSGTFHDDVQSIDNAVDATIKNSGDVFGTFTPTGASAITISGTLTIDSQGHFSGTLQETDSGNRIGQISIDLVKQP
ncbi:MAG: hypothetical protein ACHQ50_05930 [Fimbriimonadales bacterium]